MTFTSDQLIQLISSYFWPFVRISAMIMAAPVLGAANIIPKRVKLILALALTAVVVPLMPAPVNIDPFSATALLVLLQQILLGVAMGFLLQLAFSALTMGGQGIAMPMGLGFANMVDPVNGVQTSVLSTLFVILGTLLFLAVDAHLILIKVLVNSFTSLPVGPIGLSQQALMEVALWGGRIFMGGVLIALPAVIIITLINVTFGVMTRAAPQLNIFAVGFPTTMASGFLVIYLTLPNLLPRFMALVDDAFDTMTAILGLG